MLVASGFGFLKPLAPAKHSASSETTTGNNPVVVSFSAILSFVT